MATLTPNYNWLDWLKVAKLGQLHRLKSGEVYYRGKYYFSFVNGGVDGSGYLRMQTEYKCQTANAITGETLDEILRQEVLV